MIGPQLWAVRAIIALAVFLGGLFVGGRIEHDRLAAKYDAEKIADQAAATKALQNAIASNAAELVSLQEKARKASETYEQAITNLHAQYATAGSLRLPAAVCHQPAAETAAASAGRSDDAAAATVLVPQPTERDLLELTQKADGLAEQLRALQQWIKDNGLAG